MDWLKCGWFADVSVGDWAVVAADTVATKDVDAYRVASGVHAKIIKNGGN